MMRVCGWSSVLMREFGRYRFPHDKGTGSTQLRNSVCISVRTMARKRGRTISRWHIFCVKDIFHANRHARQGQMRGVGWQSGKLISDLLRVVPRPRAHQRLARCNPSELLF